MDRRFQLKRIDGKLYLPQRKLENLNGLTKGIFRMAYHELLDNPNETTAEVPFFRYKMRHAYLMNEEEVKARFIEGLENLRQLVLLVITTEGGAETLWGQYPVIQGILWGKLPRPGAVILFNDFVAAELRRFAQANANAQK